MPLANCSAKDGVAALADSAAHLAHCGLDGQTHVAAGDAQGGQVRVGLAARGHALLGGRGR